MTAPPHRHTCRFHWLGPRRALHSNVCSEVPPCNTKPIVAFLRWRCLSTPLVAGAAALVRQHLVQQRGHHQDGVKPSGALIKAFLINGAESIAPGQFVADAVGVPPVPATDETLMMRPPFRSTSAGASPRATPTSVFLAMISQSGLTSTL